MKDCNNKIIMLMDMDAFFASCEQQEKPFLRGKPIAVGGKNVVAACSYEAKKYGVKSGMSTFEALKICPDLIVVPGDMEKYASTSREIMRMLPDYTPEIEIFSIDEAFLDITGTIKFWNNDPVFLAEHLRRRIRKRFGITASIGISYNKLIAKLAASMAKPDGVKYIEKKDTHEILENLPVDELSGIGRKLKIKLNELGIATCGELGKFPVKILKRLFGQYGMILHYMAIGEDRGEVKELTPKNRSIGHSRTIPGGIRDYNIARIYLLKLCEMVGRRVRKAGFVGRTVTLTIRYDDFFTFSKQKSLYDYIDAGEDIYKEALYLFNRIETGKSIRLVGIILSGLVKASRQITIGENTDNIRFLHALDSVNNRYGEDTIKRASFSLIDVPVKSISNFEKHLDLKL